MRAESYRPAVDQARDEPGLHARRASVGRHLGSQRLGASPREVDPGEAAPTP